MTKNKEAYLPAARASPQRWMESATAITTSVREVTEDLTIEVFSEAAADGTLGTVKGTLARGNMINRNRRYYPTEVFRKAAEAAADDLEAGRLYGLLGHPEWGDSDRGRTERIAIRWDTITIEGDDVIGAGVIVGTLVGQEVAALRKAKVALGLSTNGTGSARYVPAKEVDSTYPDPDELIVLMNDDYRFLTVDVVNDPSNVHAAINKESLARIAEATREQKESNMTLEELKAKFPELYEQVMAMGLATATAESLKTANAGLFAEVQALAPKPAATEGAEDKGVIDRLVQLESENKRLQESHKQTERQAIAREMLNAAELPVMGKSGDIDLDARFRAQLESAAMNSENAETARTAVASLIEERRALIGASLPSYSRPGGNPGIPRREESKVSQGSGLNSARAGLGLN